MNTNFAIDYIPRRMRELGFGNQYLTRWRQFQVLGGETLHIDADNEYFLLIEPSNLIGVRSKFGVYDQDDEGINEMQYEHRGKIDVVNKSEDPLLVLFIQIIPKHKNCDNGCNECCKTR